MKPSLRVLARLDWGIVLLTAALGLLGCVFIHSATQDDPARAALPFKHALFLTIAAGLGLACVVVPYGRLLRHAWSFYVAAIVALALLPWLGVTVNGATRWYRLPGFMVQPTEIAKIAQIVALAAWLRFRVKASTKEGLIVPLLITAVPAFLVMRQPDLGSSLVFWPVLLAMCYAAGTSSRAILGLMGVGALGLVLAYFAVMHDYQQQRVDMWITHFAWETQAAETDPDVAAMLRGAAYQPWQSLIAIGSGGWTGFGLGQGPQNRYDFLPYRFDDYVFSVVAEETGLLGATALLGAFAVLVLGLLRIALRTRERFGRLLVIGVAAQIGAQAWMHVAVCAWLVPATGLPLPFVSYGGSSTLASVLAVSMALNVGARREPVLAADGFA